jgi:hypothetical protein
MTTPYPPPYPEQQPSSGTPASSGGGKPPSWWWFLGPMLLMLLSGVVFVVMLVGTVQDISQVDARVPADGEPHAVSVPAGDRMLFTDAQTGSEPPCTITDDEGREIEQRDIFGDFTMSQDGREWSGLTRFDAGDGDIVVTCAQQQSGVAGEVLVTPAHEIGSFIARIFGTILIPMALFGIGFLWAIVLGVLILVRRTSR